MTEDLKWLTKTLLMGTARQNRDLHDKLNHKLLNRPCVYCNVFSGSQRRGWETIRTELATWDWERACAWSQGNTTEGIIYSSSEVYIQPTHEIKVSAVFCHLAFVFSIVRSIRKATTFRKLGSFYYNGSESNNCHQIFDCLNLSPWNGSRPRFWNFAPRSK